MAQVEPNSHLKANPTVTTKLLKGDEKAYLDVVIKLLEINNPAKKNKQLITIMNDDSQLKTSYPNLTYSLKIKRPREPNALYLIEIEDNTSKKSIGHISFWTSPTQESSREVLADYSHYVKQTDVESRIPFEWVANMIFEIGQEDEDIYFSIEIKPTFDVLLTRIVELINDQLKKIKVDKTLLSELTKQRLQTNKRLALGLSTDYSETSRISLSTRPKLFRSFSGNSETSDDAAENISETLLKDTESKTGDGTTSKLKSSIKGYNETDAWNEVYHEAERLKQDKISNPFTYYKTGKITIKEVYDNWQIIYETIRQRVDLNDYVESLFEYIETFEYFMTNSPKSDKVFNSNEEIKFVASILKMYSGLKERNIDREYLGYCLKQYLRIFLLIFYNEKTHKLKTGDDRDEIIIFLNTNIVSTITSLYKTTSIKFIPNMLHICIRTYCFRYQLSKIEKYSTISCSDEKFYLDFVTYLDDKNFEEQGFFSYIYFILIYYDFCMEMLNDDVLNVFPNELTTLSYKLDEMVYKYVEEGREPIEKKLREKNLKEEDIEEKLKKLDELNNKNLDKYYDEFMEDLKQKIVTRIVEFNDSKKTTVGGNIKKQQTRKLRKLFKCKKTIKRKKHIKCKKTRRRYFI